MEAVMPFFIAFGGIVLAAALILVGVYMSGRSRGKSGGSGELLTSTSAEPAQGDTSRSSAPDSILLYLEANGTATVEIEGRRFNRLSDIMDDRLVQRALAAVGAMQRFAGVTSDARPALTALNDELRAGQATEDSVFVVEYKGQRYRKLTDVRDGETGRQLLNVIDKLVAFSQGRVAPPSVTEARPTGREGASQGEFLRKIAAPVAAPVPLKMPGLIDSLRRPAPKAEPLPLGIAGQIEAILRKQLLDNALLRERSIHIVTAADGSLSVEVEGQIFHWPDDVLDPAVRDAVQEAIRTWEKEI